MTPDRDSGELAILLRQAYKKRVRRGRTLAIVSAGLLVWTLADKFARIQGIDMTTIYPGSSGVVIIENLLWNLGVPIALFGVLLGSLYYYHYRQKMQEPGEIEQYRKSLQENSNK